MSVSYVSWITIEQAAKVARVHRRTIYNWLGTGKLEFVRTAGGNVRINPASLFRSPGA